MTTKTELIEAFTEKFKDIKTSDSPIKVKMLFEMFLEDNLTEQLNLRSVVPNDTLCCEPKDYKILNTGSVICKVCKKTIAI